MPLAQTFEEPKPRPELLFMVVKIAVIIFAVEAMIMVAFDQIGFDALPVVPWIIDSAVLTALASPIIYFGVARPFSLATRDATARLRTQLKESQRLLEQNKRLSASLRATSLSTAEAHERILQKTGADLHDGPAQLLTFAILQLHRLKPIVEHARDDKKALTFEKLTRAVRDALQEIRGISMGLSLPELSTATMVETIELAVRRHEELTGSKVEVIVRDLPDALATPYRICAYRLIQEALSNAFRHGRPTVQRVIAEGASKLSVTVEDNGQGFDPMAASGKGLGLPGMRARVYALGGSLDIRSRPKQGTVVTAAFDFTPEYTP